MPSSPEQEPDAAAAPEEPVERYGPLLVQRVVKDDGRALIRYERAREERRP